MSDPGYEAIRARERAEAESARVFTIMMKAAAQAISDFFGGRAALTFTPKMTTLGRPDAWIVRFVRDQAE